jgi:hypothetical protein
VLSFDPVLKVHVTFFQGHNPTNLFTESVEQGGPKSLVSRFLDRGGGLCYEVKDMESHLAFCRSVDTIIIRPSVPAVAFGEGGGLHGCDKNAAAD